MCICEPPVYVELAALECLMPTPRGVPVAVTASSALPAGWALGDLQNQAPRPGRSLARQEQRQWQAVTAEALAPTTSHGVCHDNCTVHHSVGEAYGAASPLLVLSRFAPRSACSFRRSCTPTASTCSWTRSCSGSWGRTAIASPRRRRQSRLVDLVDDTVHILAEMVIHLESALLPWPY